MRNYMIRRSLHSVIIVLVVVSGIFLITNVLGDPITLMIPAEAPIGQYEEMRREHGFDRPLYVQFADFWGVSFGGILAFPTVSVAMPSAWPWTASPRPPSWRGRPGL